MSNPIDTPNSEGIDTQASGLESMRRGRASEGQVDNSVLEAIARNELTNKSESEEFQVNKEFSATPVGNALFPKLDKEESDLSNIINNMELMEDVPLEITVLLGKTKYPIKTIAKLAQGSVIELDGFVGEPMTILVQGLPFAKGETVVVNERFGIRLTEIIDKKTQRKAK